MFYQPSVQHADAVPIAHADPGAVSKADVVPNAGTDASANSGADCGPLFASDIAPNTRANDGANDTAANAHSIVATIKPTNTGNTVSLKEPDVESNVGPIGFARSDAAADARAFFGAQPRADAGTDVDADAHAFSGAQSRADPWSNVDADACAHVKSDFGADICQPGGNPSPVLAWGDARQTP